MDSTTTGVGLVLGRVLMPWCDQIKPNTLERYIEIGGFQGYGRIKDMSPLDVLAELRNSGLRDREATAEPVYLNWQKFLRRQDPGVLVVDATQYDDRCQSGAFLLTHNPFALVESLLIASVACQANKCVVLLPPALQDYEAILLNVFEAVLANSLCQGQSLDLELLREAQPSIFVHGPVVPFKESILMQKLETWLHLPLVFSLGATRYKTMAPEGQTGTYLLTVGGSVRSPGLVEVPMGGNLSNILGTLTGGLIPGFVPKIISLDNGFGGFLPISAVEERLSPEEMSSSYVTPSPSTIWLLGNDVCIVDNTRKALYGYWLLSGQETSDSRVLVARAARMVTEITLGKGVESHLTELKALGRDMAGRGLAPAWPLLSSIIHFRDQWTSHVREGHCPSGVCFQVAAPPCQRSCPSCIDIPGFLALIGHEQYEDAIRSHINGQSTSIHLRYGVPCSLRSFLPQGTDGFPNFY